MSKIPVEIATGVLILDGRVFIQQRLDDDIWGSLWEFPGGQLEKGETAEEAVVREFREETDLLVEVLSKITTVVEYYPKHKVTLHAFMVGLCTEERTEPALNAAQNWCWESIEQLLTYAFPEVHQKLIDFMLYSDSDSFFNQTGSQSD